MDNGLIYILQTLGTLALVLVCFRLGRAWIMGYVAMAAVMMNLVVVKQMTLFGLDATGGNVLYASLFMATDLLSEYWGPRQARRAVHIGLMSGLFFLATTQVIMLYAPNDFDVAQPHMRGLFQFLPRIVLGAFWGVFPIAQAIFFTWILKVIVAALDTPFVYLAARIKPAELTEATP